MVTVSTGVSRCRVFWLQLGRTCDRCAPTSSCRDVTPSHVVRIRSHIVRRRCCRVHQVALLTLRCDRVASVVLVVSSWHTVASHHFRCASLALTMRRGNRRVMVPCRHLRDSSCRRHVAMQPSTLSLHRRVRRCAGGVDEVWRGREREKQRGGHRPLRRIRRHVVQRCCCGGGGLSL